MNACLGESRARGISNGNLFAFVLCAFIGLAGWGIIWLLTGFWETRQALVEELSKRAQSPLTTTGAMEETNPVQNPTLRETFAEMLRPNPEVEKQCRVMDERRRIARIRSSPVYRELKEWIAFARKANQETREKLDEENQQAIIRVLETKGNKKNREKITPLEALSQSGKASPPDSILEKLRYEVELGICSKRAVLKERFRTYSEFGKKDWLIFDHEVDELMDRLLEEIKTPYESNITDVIQVFMKN
jgi:hypothetical protein